MDPLSDQQETGVSSADLSRQVERIAGSALVRSSANLQRMLHYLAAKTIKGHAGNLKEYTVGLECFGRPESYDPRSDATVRVHTWKLRAKLRLYYENEGRDDPIVIDLPKGGFALSFTLRTHPRSAPAPPPDAGGRFRTPLPWAGAASMAGLLAIVVWLGRGPAAEARPGYEIRNIWGPVLEAPGPVTVVLGSPMFLRTGRGVLRAPGVNSASDLRQAGLAEAVRDGPSPQVAYPYVGYGETTAAFSLANLFSGHKGGLVLTRSIAADRGGRRPGHLILLGSPKTNAAMRPFQAELDFRVHDCGVWNERPRANEPSKYLCVVNGQGEVVEAFAVFSRLPADAHGRATYLLAGGSAEAMALVTEAATSQDTLGRVIRTLALDGRSLPEAFQVVLRANFSSGGSAGIQVAAYRAWGSSVPLR